MDFFTKMMGDMDLSKIVPQKEIIDYKIISEYTLDEFNYKSKKLIDNGFEPIGSLIPVVLTSSSPMITIPTILYTKEFVKYKKTE